jgi:hypothetical protein
MNSKETEDCCIRIFFFFFVDALDIIDELFYGNSHYAFDQERNINVLTNDTFSPL